MSKHILALVTDAYGVRGGIAQYNRDLVAAFAACPTIGSIDILPRGGDAPTADLPPKTRQRSPIHDPVRYSLRALAAAIARRPDIVFCGHLFMAPLALLIARLTGARLIVQAHGVEVWPRPKRLRRAAVEAADLVLCVSRDTRARVIGWASIQPERAVVAPNTVSEAYSPGDGSALRAELGLGDKRVLLCVGRLASREQYKGQDRVIRLIRRLRDRGLDVVFLIAGAGDDRSRLERLARTEGVADFVTFLGDVPSGQLPELYRAADLYVMPSTAEGFGIAFLEAMASGTPALGLAAGGAADALVEGDAVFVADLEGEIARRLAAPKPDPASLAAAVRARFGRAVFEDRVAKAIARVVDQDPVCAA